MSYVLAFLGFAVLIIAHEAGHFTAAKAVGMRVERFALFFPPLIAKKKVGETEYGIGAIPLGGYVKITGMNPDQELPDEVKPRAYCNMPVWRRIVVISAGPAVNIAIALILLFGLPLERVTGTSNEVGAVQAGAPAADKIRTGDRIVAVDGVHGNPQRLIRQISSHRCPGAQRVGCRAAEPATVTVRRGGQAKTFTIRPHYTNDGGLSKPRIGVGFNARTEQVGSTWSVTGAGQRAWYITSGTVSAVAQVFNPEKRKQISGVVGSYKVTQEAFSFKLATALTLLAVISLSLAIINLFPFLPLDGGHIFFALLEKVRGKAVPYAVMERASVVGFMLVMVLFVIGLSNDIGRLSSGGFDVGR